MPLRSANPAEAAPARTTLTSGARADVIADPSEKNNIASEHSELVETMAAQLAERNIPYVDGRMAEEDWRHASPGGQADFECNWNAAQEWWGGYAGPCCRRKGQ